MKWLIMAFLLLNDDDDDSGSDDDDDNDDNFSFASGMMKRNVGCVMLQAKTLPFLS